ncbi:hypothetical protein ACFC08_17985 [Streptomyces sp. NPDC056112]|uniref:hypothetical protein n=1 Tax=Streptomyces sp. NPDC056112 TaxID=3345715 RepID=UPI0035DD5128
MNRRTSRHHQGPLVDAEPVRRHVRNLMAAGVSIARLADHSEVGFPVVSQLLYPRGPGRPASIKIRLANARRILAVRAEDVVTGYVDPTGTHRRLQALMANGWPQLRLGPYIGLHPSYVNALLRQPGIYGTTAMAVAAGYDRLWNQDPRQHGIVEGTYKKVRTLARTNGWAPPGAWDDDTIDDPNAHPEWTGHCGTDRGYWVHRRQQLPMCARCEQAHQKWLAEHADLDPRERNKLQFSARATAVAREADLAHDARELMRYGANAEQAAARLGVSKQHLQQALVRHPADVEVAA